MFINLLINYLGGNMILINYLGGSLINFNYLGGINFLLIFLERNMLEKCLLVIILINN